LYLADTHLDNSNKNVGSSLRHSSTTTPSSIRLVTPTTGKVSPSTSLQFQFIDKASATTNGTFSTSKAYIFNPQQSNCSSSPMVTLIPPGTTSPKMQTLISSTNDLANSSDHNNCKPNSFLSKNRLTFVQPLVSNSVTPKLVIQQNPTSNIWSQPSTTKIRKDKKKHFLIFLDVLLFVVSAKMLSRPVQLISSSDHSNLSSPTSNDNPIFTTKNLGKIKNVKFGFLFNFLFE
jgi:hypothetical protein